MRPPLTPSPEGGELARAAPSLGRVGVGLPFVPLAQYLYVL